MIPKLCGCGVFVPPLRWSSSFVFKLPLYVLFDGKKFSFANQLFIITDFCKTKSSFKRFWALWPVAYMLSWLHLEVLELTKIETFGFECSWELPNPGGEGILVLVILLLTISLKKKMIMCLTFSKQDNLYNLQSWIMPFGQQSGGLV